MLVCNIKTDTPEDDFLGVEKYRVNSQPKCVLIDSI
jgi:hypothetical protein